MLNEAPRLARYAWRMATKPDQVTIDGIRLNVPDGASGRVLASIYAEKYEGLEVRELPRLLRPDDVVVEAGAAIGFVGLVCERIVGADNVHMIEANRDLIPEIMKNWRANGAGEPKVHHGLAAAEDGPAVEFRVANLFWASSVIDHGQTKRIDKVDQIGLNALFKKTSASVFICDIEGGEFALLPSLDFSGLRLIVIELHEQRASPREMKTALQLFDDRGFELRQSFKNEVFIFERRS
ncbi:MAG: hypothetical protein AAFW81_01890 [Pseudomonadota bacterium]